MFSIEEVVSTSSLYQLMLLEDVGMGPELFLGSGLVWTLTLSCLIGCLYVGNILNSMSSLLNNPWSQGSVKK